MRARLLAEIVEAFGVRAEDCTVSFGQMRVSATGKRAIFPLDGSRCIARGFSLGCVTHSLLSNPLRQAAAAAGAPGMVSRMSPLQILHSLPALQFETVAPFLKDSAASVRFMRSLRLSRTRFGCGSPGASVPRAL